MIHINLLPYRQERRQKQIIQHIAIFSAALLLTISLCVGAYLWNASKLSTLQQQHVSLVTQNKALLKKIGKIKDLEKVRADVEQKLKLVDRLQQGRFDTLATLTGLSKAIPENVWLTHITDQDGTLKLSGRGESNKAVATFMRQLDQSPLFSNVRLQVISRQKLGNIFIRKFSLTLSRIIPPVASKAKKKSGGKAS